MRLGFFTLLLAGGVASIGRLKRQALPSNHVQVHSLNSNVSVSDVVVVVTSSDSRIDLLEKKLNLSTWATSSNVSFDTFDTFVNYTATSTETFARMQGVELHSQSTKSEFSMTTSKSFDAHINNSLTGRVNVSIADSGMKIQALEGKWADVTASSREDNKAAKSMNIYSNISMGSSYERRLVLSAVDRLYDMEAVLLGARVRTSYGDVTIDIDPDYKTARIYTNAHTIELKTSLSPFGIEFNNQRMLISAPFEETTATVLRNTSDVHFVVGQLSQLRLSRGGGKIQLGGNEAQADKINVTSSRMSMDLFETREMDARTNQSHISMMTNSTTAELTSLYHHLHVSGGVPQMVLLTGNLSLAISTKPETPVQPTLFPGFSAPPDKFATVGPPRFPGDDEKNGGQFSRSTSSPSEIEGSTGNEVTVVTESGGFTGEETERTVGYRTHSPDTETTIGEVIGVTTVKPVEGGNNGEGTTDVSIVTSPDATLLPAETQSTTEQTIVSTDGSISTDGQVVGGETMGETTVAAESTTQSVIGEATISVPTETEVSTAVPDGGETTPSEQTTIANGQERTLETIEGQTDGGEVTVVGSEATTLEAGLTLTSSSEGELSTVVGEESTTVEGVEGTTLGEGTTSGNGEAATVDSSLATTSSGEVEATTLVGGEGGTSSEVIPDGEIASTTEAPVGEETTERGDSTTVTLSTILTIDSSSIPSDFPTPATISMEGLSSTGTEGVISTSSPESETSGDTTTDSSVTDQSTPGIPTPPELVPTDFVTPGSLLPEDYTTASDEFVFGQYSTDSIPEPEALTSLEKRLVPSLFAVVVVLRML